MTRDRSRVRGRPVADAAERGRSRRCRPPLPGQYVVLRLHRAGGGRRSFAAIRSRRPVSTERYRISVKVEPQRRRRNVPARARPRRRRARRQRAARELRPAVRTTRPVVLLSAGIGATPVLAMLHALAAARSTRPVLWLHGARDRQHHPFAAEVRRPACRARARPQPRLLQPARRARQAGRGLRRQPATCRGRSSRRSACRARRMSTCAGRLASWRR